MSEPVEARFAISNMRGLHARAAAKFCDVAARFKADIRVSKDGITVGGCSLMALLMLGADMGSEIHVTAEGPDADDAVGALRALVENRFGESA